MAKYIWQHYITDAAGNVLAGASVTVTDKETGALASLYSDRAGTTGISNPMTADANGFAKFYVAAGRYKIEATSSSITATFDDVIIGADFSGEWVDPHAATFVDTDTLTVSGNPTDDAGVAVFHAGRRVRVLLETSDTYVYADIESTSYNAGTDKTTVNLKGITDSAGTADGLANEPLTVWVGLTPAKVPATAFPVQALGGPIIPAMFGAAGDGSTDDTTALQAAIDAASSAGGVIDGLGKTYLASSALALKSNVTLRNCTIDMTGISSSPFHGLVAEGSLGTNSALTADADYRDFSVTVTDGTKFTAGDYVILQSSANYDYSGYNVDRGEVKRIRSVSSNTVSFTAPISDNYATADAATLHNVSWVENVHFDGVTVQGSDTAARGERGISLRYVKDFSVTNCRLLDQDHYQVEVTASILGRVRDNYLHGVFYDGVNGTIFYGVALLNSTTWVNVEGNHGDRNRHLVVTSAFSEGQGYYGQPMYCTIAHNKMFDAMAGDAGRSFAYECHGFGRFIDWIGNQANGCYAGLRLENGNDNVVTGNIFRGYAYHGVIIGGSGLNNRNIIIADNIISQYTGEITTGAPSAVRFEAAPGAAFEHIRIAGNQMLGVHNAAAAVGYGVTFDAASYEDVEVSDNQIVFAGDAVAFAVSSLAGADNLSFLGNRILGFRGGFSLAGSFCVVRGNKVERAVVALNGDGVNSTGDRNIIQGNTFTRLAAPVETAAGSTNNLVVNNQVDRCGGVASDAGTGNVYRDNDVL